MPTINSPFPSTPKPTKEKSFLEKLTSQILEKLTTQSSCLNKLKMWQVITINVFTLFIIWIIYSNKSHLKIGIALYAVSVFVVLVPLSLLIAKAIILNGVTPENIKKISSLLTKNRPAKKTQPIKNLTYPELNTY